MKQRRWNTRRGVEDGLSLLVGAGIGMAGMYLLDPQSGRRRRRELIDRTRDVAERAGEAVAPVIASAAQSVGDLGQRMAGRAGEYAAGVVQTGKAYLNEAGESISDRAREMRTSVAARRPFSMQRSRGIPVVPGLLGAAALFGLGVGCALLCDPVRGRARRAILRDKSFHMLNETGEFFRRAGKRISNRMRGSYYETTRHLRSGPVTDEQLCQRIRSQMGRHVRNMGDVVLLSENGYVTISGLLPSDEIDSAINALLDVHGVRGVNNQLRSREPAASENAP